MKPSWRQWLTDHLVEIVIGGLGILATLWAGTTSFQARDIVDDHSSHTTFVGDHGHRYAEGHQGPLGGVREEGGKQPSAESAPVLAPPPGGDVPSVQINADKVENQVTITHPSGPVNIDQRRRR